MTAWAAPKKLRDGNITSSPGLTFATHNAILIASEPVLMQVTYLFFNESFFLILFSNVETYFPDPNQPSFKTSLTLEISLLPRYGHEAKILFL